MESALTLLFENEALHDKVIKPIKRRAVPVVIGGVVFNLLLLALLVYLVLRLEHLSQFVRGLQAGSV